MEPWLISFFLNFVLFFPPKWSNSKAEHSGGFKLKEENKKEKKKAFAVLRVTSMTARNPRQAVCWHASHGLSLSFLYQDSCQMACADNLWVVTSLESESKD